MVPGHYVGLGEPSVPQISTQVLLYLPGLFIVGTVAALIKTFAIKEAIQVCRMEMKDVSQTRKGPKPDHSLLTPSVPMTYYHSTIN